MVDDHPIVSEAVAGTLNAHEDFSVRTASTGTEALRLYEQARPDVVLCDLSLDENMSGIELTSRIVKGDAEAKVVVFTSFTDPDNVTAALDAGAVGYLAKSMPPSELAQRLRDAAEGEPVYDSQTQSIVFSLFRKRRTVSEASPILTPRELEVLTELCRTGGSTQEIAEHLFLAESTVTTHLKNVMTKLGVSSRTKAVVVAHKTGLVKPPS